MSDPIRYDFIYNENYASVEREEHKEGDYVSYQDYASLKAELDKYRKDVTNSVDDLLDERKRLKAEVERLRDGVETMTYHAPGVETTAWVRAVEYDRLKAQVERLAKAGDAMADNCEAMTSSEHDCYDSDLMKFVRAWNAANEGKPNA